MRGKWKWNRWGIFEFILILFVVILAYLSFQFQPQPVATNSSQQAEVTSSFSQDVQQTIQVMPGRQTLEAFIIKNERIPDATEISQIRTATAPETNALMTAIALPSPVP